MTKFIKTLQVDLRILGTTHEFDLITEQIGLIHSAEYNENPLSAARDSGEEKVTGLIGKLRNTGLKVESCCIVSVRLIQVIAFFLRHVKIKKFTSIQMSDTCPLHKPLKNKKAGKPTFQFQGMQLMPNYV